MFQVRGGAMTRVSDLRFLPRFAERPKQAHGKFPRTSGVDTPICLKHPFISRPKLRAPAPWTALPNEFYQASTDTGFTHRDLRIQFPGPNDDSRRDLAIRPASFLPFSEALGTSGVIRLGLPSTERPLAR